MGDECGGNFTRNIDHPTKRGKVVNCRNIWFREFWEQHHKCTFSSSPLPEKPRCNGNEELQGYVQEGLVPMVGEFLKGFFTGF